MDGGVFMINVQKPKPRYAPFQLECLSRCMLRPSRGFSCCVHCMLSMLAVTLHAGCH